MTYHVFCTHSSVSGHLGGFQFGLLEMTVDMWVQVCVWTCAFIFLGFILRSGTAGVYSFIRRGFFSLSFATSVGFGVGAKVMTNAPSLVGGLNWRAYCRTTLYERTPSWSSDSGAQENISRSFRLVCILDFTSSLEGGLDFLKLGNFLITQKYFEFFLYRASLSYCGKDFQFIYKYLVYCNFL